MKREENMKYWKKILKFYFFQYLKNSYKIQTTFHQYQNYTAHPHARTCKVSRKYINAFLSYSAKTKRDGQTDGQTDGRTDGGRCNISRPGPSAPREIITYSWCHVLWERNWLGFSNLQMWHTNIGKRSELPILSQPKFRHSWTHMSVVVLAINTYLLFCTLWNQICCERNTHVNVIISPKFENFGGIMFLVPPHSGIYTVFALGQMHQF